MSRDRNRYAQLMCDNLPESVEQLAPRPQCSCRNCLNAREYALDPRLAALLRETQSYVLPENLTRPISSAILHRLVIEYFNGRIAAEALHMEIILGLMRELNRMTDMMMTARMSSIPNMIVTKEVPP